MDLCVKCLAWLWRLHYEITLHSRGVHLPCQQICHLKYKLLTNLLDDDNGGMPHTRKSNSLNTMCDVIEISPTWTALIMLNCIVLLVNAPCCVIQIGHSKVTPWLKNPFEHAAVIKGRKSLISQTLLRFGLYLRPVLGPTQWRQQARQKLSACSSFHQMLGSCSPLWHSPSPQRGRPALSH